MILRPLYRVTIRTTATRCFSSRAPLLAKNRLYAPVRTVDEFNTLLLLSASSKTPLLTLWVTQWENNCSGPSSVLKSLIERDGIGESAGGVGYAEVELDAMTVGDLRQIYMINAIPTLLAFSRSEPQLETKVERLEDLKNKAFLTKWVEDEAKRGGEGGAGGGFNFFGLFGR